MNWKGKSVLVTGAGGFIGSHLTERLVELGAKVRGFVHYNALGTLGWLDESPLRKEVDVIAADIADRDSVQAAVQGVEIVFHLAALIGIPYSYKAPGSYVRTNIEGTLNILRCGLDAGVGRVVHTSTSEVYGTARREPIDEDHPLQGQSPYSASKIGADKLAESFHLSFNLPVVTVRPFNTFGPRQSARAVIPTIISQCLTQPRVRLGSLHPTRDLNYVGNTVDGFVLAASTDAAIGKTINLGSGRKISIGNLAELIASMTNQSIVIEHDDQRTRPAKSEVGCLLADNTLARTLLGWEPHVSLEEGLKTTIEWMRKNLTRYRPNEFTV
jgi:NAD dependent epimerase/dehydratase